MTMADEGGENVPLTERGFLTHVGVLNTNVMELAGTLNYVSRELDKIKKLTAGEGEENNEDMEEQKKRKRWGKTKAFARVVPVLGQSWDFHEEEQDSGAESEE
jgi:hypothetical protein